MATLLALSQCEGELFSQFVVHFTVEIRGFPNAHPSLIMLAFLMGLFFWLLIEKPPTTIPKMLQCTQPAYHRGSPNGRRTRG
ncbi:hypothetical protein C4D60_Mb08t34140 [Musa balbisiana]|uniref:Uncharacterized protein n=1 Tax=Musa balbisiana TaxID=52838 RepID=A0A4S8K8K5_MUSBA|nr:hypothetical protein C4D60_Mb08t34140 [Musa balbisiana]